MSKSSYPESGILRTSSPVRVWWLRKMHGYHVVDVHRRPKRSWYGRLRLKFVYKMAPGSRL